MQRKLSRRKLSRRKSKRRLSSRSRGRSYQGVDQNSLCTTYRGGNEQHIPKILNWSELLKASGASLDSVDVVIMQYMENLIPVKVLLRDDECLIYRDMGWGDGAMSAGGFALLFTFSRDLLPTP